MKRPSFQFYPGDWLHDPALRACSLAARGLWADMLCYMHQSTPYGYLKVGQMVILPETLARMVGETPTEVERLLRELGDAGVFGKDHEGFIFSRRLVRDENIRQARAAGGIKGGNPELTKRKAALETITLKDNLTPNLELTPSSSSSSSVLDHDDEEKGAGNSQPEPIDPAKMIETYLQGKTRQLMIGQTVYQEILAWLKTSAGDTDAISRGIDEGLKMFQQDSPNAVPDTGLFYRSFVRKAIERSKMQTNQRTIPLVVPVRRPPEEDETSKKLRPHMQGG